MSQPPRSSDTVREAQDHSSVRQAQRTKRLWPFTGPSRAVLISGSAPQNIDDSCVLGQESVECFVHRATVGRMDPAHRQAKWSPFPAHLAQSRPQSAGICVVAGHGLHEGGINRAPSKLHDSLSMSRDNSNRVPITHELADHSRKHAGPTNYQDRVLGILHRTRCRRHRTEHARGGTRTQSTCARFVGSGWVWPPHCPMRRSSRRCRRVRPATAKDADLGNRAPVRPGARAPEGQPWHSGRVTFSLFSVRQR